MTVAPFALTESAALFDNLPPPIEDSAPRNMEAYDQGHGCIVYRTTVPAGPAAMLRVGRANDFAWVFLNGKPAGVMDRRSRHFQVPLPAREKSARLDILVEAMGHVNFGNEIHDRKGLQGPVQLAGGNQTNELLGQWQVYPLHLDASQLAGLNWQSGAVTGPAFWRGSFNLEKATDTFLDLQNWGKGVVWINGHCLARYWNIGPSQTAYIPGPWLRAGSNEVVILDLLGPSQPTVAGLEKPILGELRPELDFRGKSSAKGTLLLNGLKPIYTNSFAPGGEAREVKFPQPISGRQFCIE